MIARSFAIRPGYRAVPLRPVLDWSEYPGGAGGFQGAAEMCNNNGACRKLEGGAMCPSYRVTRDEQHVTRGRANTLRLALSGALGKEALASDKMAQALELCVACKACKRECPTGVDMARMKIEVDAARAKRNGFTLFDRLVGSLPRYAPFATRFAWLINLRDRVPGAALLTEWVAGFAATRPLPVWRSDFFRAPADAVGPDTGREVVLFADSFNRYFEPRTISAALAVLVAGGYRVHLPNAVDGSSRPLCCGRTYLSTGDIDAARREAKRSLAALAPFAERGVPIIGLEPSCLLSFRDEILALGMGEAAKRVAKKPCSSRSSWSRRRKRGKLKLAFAPVESQGLAAHPLPSESLRHRHDGRARARARARSRSRDRGVELLRHGGILRIPGEDAFGVEGDGRACAFARGASGRARHDHRCRRHLLSLSNR